MAADLGLAPKKKPISLPQRTGPMDTTPVPYGPQASGNTLMPMRNAPLRVPAGGPTGYRSPFDVTPQGPQAPVFPVPQQANVPTGPAAIAAHTAASIPGVPGPQLPPIPPTAPAQYASQVQQHGLMDNRGAELFQRETGYMPNRTVGGAYGPPQGPLPFEQKRPINLGNALFQGAQPGTVAGKPAFVNGPESDRGRSVDHRTSSQSEIDAARDLFAARRGGPAARRTAYESRTAAAATERSTNRKTREMAKADARRVRMGDMTFEERLAASDPQSAAQRALGEAQIGATAGFKAADLGMRRDDIAARERMSAGHNSAAVEAAKWKAVAGGADPAKLGLVAPAEPTKPEPPAPPGLPSQLFGQAGEGLANLFGFGAHASAAANAGLNRPTRRGVVRSGAPGQIIKPSRSVKHDDLIPNPDDTPAQAQARADLRRKYSGMRTQLVNSGRLQPGI